MTARWHMAFDFKFAALKAGFFDSSKILDRQKRYEARVQSKFGAFTRRRMKSSLRYGKGTAAPGKPPVVHQSKGFTRAKKDKKTGATSRQARSPLRELVFFARDPAADSVVVGPVVFGSGVARTIEKGGPGFRKDPRTGQKRPAVFAPHPFAEPAGRAEAARFPELLRNSVK